MNEQQDVRSQHVWPKMITQNMSEIVTHEQADIIPELESYDRFVFMFSGGKDSTAIVLYFLELLEQLELEHLRDRIELWHHDIDGKGRPYMDWPVTPAYCQAFAEAFGLPIYESWKSGGFERELNRTNEPTAEVVFQSPNGSQVVGGNGKPNTRLKFPAKSKDLQTRWCSAYLKIDVASMALRNDERFRNTRTLVMTGERAMEGGGRSKYNIFEPHRADLRNGKSFTRHIDHWRPVHKWLEQDVWDIIERWGVNAHPAYHLGWGRLSCMTCIFGSKNQWASAREVAYDQVQNLILDELRLGFTIDNKLSIVEQIELGTAYDGTGDIINLVLSQGDQYESSDIILTEEDWKLPEGAFGEQEGSM